MDLECELVGAAAGPFEGQVHVFVNDGGVAREIVLVVRGEWLADDELHRSKASKSPGE